MVEIAVTTLVCATILGVMYMFKNIWRDCILDVSLGEGVNAINDAVDDNEQTMLAMGRRLEELQSDIAGHLTRLDDIDGRAVVEVRAVNYANSVNTVYRHSVQVRVNGGEWADIPVETEWGTDEEASMYIIVNKQDEKADD
jgi:hypothetical protein